MAKRISEIYLLIVSTCVLQNSVAHFIYSERHGRIIGGDIMKIEESPFVIALEVDRRSLCGGAILNERWAITAAHCFGLSLNASRAVVRAGSGQRGTGGVEHQVVKIVKHPEFMFFKGSHDVGLMEVYPSFKYSPVVQPVTLPETGVRPKDGDLSSVYGWGYTKETGEPSLELRAVVLPIYPYDDCVAIYNTSFTITKMMICAGYRDGGRDACVFDSGGPLIWHKAIHGLVSWGWGCARALRPGVYTAISEPDIKNWIMEVINTENRNEVNIQPNNSTQIQQESSNFSEKVDRTLLNSKFTKYY